MISRDGISREEVISRMNKQMDENEKLKLCDAVIINDETRLVIPQVMELHEKFTRIEQPL